MSLGDIPGKPFQMATPEKQTDLSNKWAVWQR